MGSMSLAAVHVSTNIRAFVVYVSISNLWCVSICRQIWAHYLCIFCSHSPQALRTHLPTSNHGRPRQHGPPGLSWPAGRSLKATSRRREAKVEERMPTRPRPRPRFGPRGLGRRRQRRRSASGPSRRSGRRRWRPRRRTRPRSAKMRGRRRHAREEEDEKGGAVGGHEPRGESGGERQEGGGQEEGGGGEGPPEKVAGADGAWSCGPCTPWPPAKQGWPCCGRGRVEAGAGKWPGGG